MRLILGSGSPQRREILGYYGIPFEQVSSGFDEEAVPFRGDPVEYTTTLAAGKARALASRFPEAVILTADTVVFKAGKIFNKPTSEQENFEMLKELMGSWHVVVTGIVAQCGEKKTVAHGETRVLFRTLSEERLKFYHNAFKGTDKSGGYSIQKGGNIIVERMEGCFYNVVGLPITALQKVLGEMGIDLWQHLRSS